MEQITLKMDLALNNPHKTQQTKPSYNYMLFWYKDVPHFQSVRANQQLNQKERK